MQNGKSLRTFFVALFIITLLGCNLTSTINDVLVDDVDHDATLAVLQSTQTALSTAPSPTITQAHPPSPTPSAITQSENPQPQPGSISGKLSYPSEGIPPLRVVAFHINSGFYYYIETVQNQETFRIDNLPPGIYHVVEYAKDSTLSGGYSQAVPCGLGINCTNHNLIDVQVNPGQDTTGVDPMDWYAPPGSFPPDPVAPVPPADSVPVTSGSISGDLSYPSEGIPPLRVIAFNIDTGNYHFVDTIANQGMYIIGNLPPGTYHVVAFVIGGGTGAPSGGYSQAVPCGLSIDCTDHSLIDVQVSSGQVITDVNPLDWYAPEGAFPPNPIP